MATDKRKEIKRLITEAVQNSTTITNAGLDLITNRILALFAPDEECTTFYAAIRFYPDRGVAELLNTFDIDTAKSFATDEHGNGHFIAIHVPNRLLQPREATVTECTTEEAK